MIFAREPLTEALLNEALPLLNEHWAEIAHYADIPLDVDVAAYLNAEANGSVRCFTAREQVPAGWSVRTDTQLYRYDLLGYAVYFVRANLHYQTSVQAVQDVLYLHPSARGGTGARFLAYCDAQLAGEGVQVAYQHAKTAHPQLGKVLSRLGYEPVETIWSKRLDVITGQGEVAGEAPPRDSLVAQQKVERSHPCEDWCKRLADWHNAHIVYSAGDLIEFAGTMHRITHGGMVCE